MLAFSTIRSKSCDREHAVTPPVVVRATNITPNTCILRLPLKNFSALHSFFNPKLELVSKTSQGLPMCEWYIKSTCRSLSAHLHDLNLYHGMQTVGMTFSGAEGSTLILGVLIERSTFPTGHWSQRDLYRRSR